MQEILILLIAIKQLIKQYHWQAKSYQEHILADKLEEDLEDYIDEVAEVSRVTKKEVGRTYRFMSRKMKIKLLPTSPTDYIPRFASDLGLSGLVQARAIEIINKARDGGLSSGRGPNGIAAAALYVAAILLGERRTQKEVAEVTNVTEVTIRNRYSEITKLLDIKLSDY